MRDWAAGILCFVLMAAGAWAYLSASAQKTSRISCPVRLLFKGGTTMMAALLAIYGSLQSQLPAHFLIALGIAVCAAADVILEIRFKAGMLVFALGHICYIASFVMMGGINHLSILVYALLIVMIAVVTQKLKKSLDEPYTPYLLYSLIIAAMFSLALAQPLTAALGALLFVISDSLLFLGIIKEKPKVSHTAVISTYYLAQFLLALSTII